MTLTLDYLKYVLTIGKRHWKTPGFAIKVWWIGKRSYKRTKPEYHEDLKKFLRSDIRSGNTIEIVLAHSERQVREGHTTASWKNIVLSFFYFIFRLLIRSPFYLLILFSIPVYVIWWAINKIGSDLWVFIDLLSEDVGEWLDSIGP